MWFHRAKFWDAGWDQHLFRTSRLIWAETAKSLAFADWLFLFTWMAWPGLARSSNPRLSSAIKVKIVTLRVRIPIRSRWALINWSRWMTRQHTVFPAPFGQKMLWLARCGLHSPSFFGWTMQLWARYSMSRYAQQEGLTGISMRP